MSEQASPSPKRRALAIAVSFALAWSTALLTAADHPPPIGLLGLLPFLALAAALVYWRAIVYANWKARSQTRPMLRALVEGALAGLAVAAVIRCLPWLGESSIRPSTASFLVWLGVASAFGSFSAILVYFASGGETSRTHSGKRAGTV